MKFHVLGDNTKLEIDVLQRNYPDSTDFWDANWIASVIHLEIPGYMVHFEADLRTDELRDFVDELRSMNENLGGTAILKNLDSYIYLEGAMDLRGKISWNIETCYPAGIGAELTCDFESDQTYLRILIDELDRVLEAFPVLGKNPE
ncbi:hypothetical protein QMA09_04655 [Planococcus sp. APC 3906]|uniref:WapI family immunity protein n=1 Tax=Planococcus sp. APC 3906 TaxID=3035194 RepID=UPI0025B31298|nr:hypothetical protein [Planococcus sp. APC 3906]MDN3449468.1 hypothetical protein [Planococcus sp. APC 3906]